MGRESRIVVANARAHGYPQHVNGNNESGSFGPSPPQTPRPRNTVTAPRASSTSRDINKMLTAIFLLPLTNTCAGPWFT